MVLRVGQKFGLEKKSGGGKLWEDTEMDLDS
jgi:hypothetical protein